MTKSSLTKVLALGVCLVVQATGIRHLTVVLAKNHTAAHSIYADGVTVQSSGNYMDQEFSAYLKIQPPPGSIPCQILINFVELDLPKKKPCEDYIDICEWGENGCQKMIVSRFCGSFEDLFSPGEPHIKWIAEGTSVMIRFGTSQPSGLYQGFVLVVTSFYKPGTCSKRDYFECDDKHCVSEDLHCDGVIHCMDGSDENKNCSTKEEYVPIPVCGPRDRSNPSCRGRHWGERWFGLAIPMAIVMVLLFFAIAVKVRKQLCNPMALGNGSRVPLHPALRRERAIQAPFFPQRHLLGPRWICPHERLQNRINQQRHQNNVYQEVDLGTTDAATSMLLPPPYSPPDERSSNPYDPPTEGEPPPLYEESHKHTLHSDKATTAAPIESSNNENSSRHSPSSSHIYSSNPPAYQVIAPVLSINHNNTARQSSRSPTLVITSTGELSLQAGNEETRNQRISSPPPPIPLSSSTSSSRHSNVEFSL